MKIVIDTSRFAYLWWRAVHRLLGSPVKPGRCGGCGRPLNAAEREHYEFHCEQCTPLYTWDGE